MIVLHYIPNLTKRMGQAAKSVQIIHASLQGVVETHLFTGNASSSEFITAIKTYNPDIMHLHGCWNIQIAIAHRVAKHFGIPVVTSPHGALAQDILHHDFWKSRLPRILTYQFLTIRESFVIHAESEQERTDLKSLGWRNRITIVPQPASVNDNRAMAYNFKALYQKVIDTTSFNQLKPIEHQCFWTLLKSDIAANYESPTLSEESAKMFSQLTPDNWKAIQIYAIDHGVHTNILAAAQTLTLTVPRIITQLPNRYPSKSLQKKGDAEAIPADIKEKYQGNALELTLATKVHDLYTTIDTLHNNSDCPHSIKHLLDIYEVMQHQYFDETLFTEIIDAMGIRTFSERLLAVMQQLLGLSLGFMPFDPRDDRQVNTLLYNLNNLP